MNLPALTADNRGLFPIQPKSKHTAGYVENYSLRISPFPSSINTVMYVTVTQLIHVAAYLNKTLNIQD